MFIGIGESINYPFLYCSKSSRLKQGKAVVKVNFRTACDLVNWGCLTIREDKEINERDQGFSSYDTTSSVGWHSYLFCLLSWLVIKADLFALQNWKVEVGRSGVHISHSQFTIIPFSFQEPRRKVSSWSDFSLKQARSFISWKCTGRVFCAHPNLLPIHFTFFLEEAGERIWLGGLRFLGLISLWGIRLFMIC